KDVFGRSTYILASICDVFGRVVSLVAMVSIIATINLKFLLIGMIPVILTLPLTYYEAKLWPKFDKETAPYGRQTGYVQRTVYLNQYAKEYRLSNIFSVMKKKFDKACDDLVRTQVKYQKKAAILYSCWNIFSWMFLSVVAPCIVAYDVLFTGITLGSFMATLNALPRISYSTTNLLSQFVTFKQHALFVKNILEFYEKEPKISQNENGLLPLKRGNVLELKNITFTYKGQEKPVLKNVSMKIDAGQKVAFVGHNGAGKSTLVKIIMQLYEPDSGEILLNGKPIKEYNLRAYYDMFGTIFQDFQMYAMTVAENVLMRKVENEEDREKVIESLKLSGGYNKVMEFKNGIDSILTREFDKDGIALSGGENQKIAIARVFANYAPMIIID
ncbi:MAG: ABC transporter ATP-binding protein, partial [Oscillospiraceae bacterium]